MRHSRLQHQATLSGEEHAVRCPRVSAGKAPAGQVALPSRGDWSNAGAAVHERCALMRKSRGTPGIRRGATG